jgi:hypothetical protein
MGKPKSLILSMTVDEALRTHACQHNDKHMVAKGDRRLKIKVGRSHDHYCVDCSRMFIEQSIAKLQRLAAELLS